ncbi:MAG: DNA repair protein RadC [Flavihumibacter sp.]
MQAQNHSIKQWAIDDRPREKLLHKNPQALSDAELLGILLQSGTRHKTAVDLGRELLHACRNNLNELGRCSLHDMMKVKGIGKVKAATIAAALELGRRRQASAALELPSVNSSRDVAGYLQQLYQDYRQEIFVVLFLNRANRIKHQEIISMGGINGTVADPRVIMKKAIEHEASSLVISHNHPSGNLSPSKADEELTRKIHEATRLLDIKLVDHIIVSSQGYFSFADQGLI